jgi:succinyl-diaminopimelate desuccinylase
MIMQRKLALVPASLQDRGTTRESIVNLLKDLVRIPTQGGVDLQAGALEAVAEWLEARRVETEMMILDRRRNPKNKAVGLLARIGNPNHGPKYCLTACLDTATIGRFDSWDTPPFVPTELPDGWLAGRGVGDSKVGVAIFAAIIAKMKTQESQLNGQLLLLIDSDEHTGRFGAIKELLLREAHIAGVYIGYPGNESIKAGARGFYRAKVRIFGTSQHSGANVENHSNAVRKAAVLVGSLYEKRLPEEEDPSFRLNPKMTVTQIKGGRGYSSVPDSCFVRVDFRLTPSFRQRTAARFLKEIVNCVDAQMPTVRSSRIEAEQHWPSYQLGVDSPIVRALQSCAEQVLGRKVALGVSGPSNVGNFLRSKGVDATCGFGVTVRNIHAADEAIDLNCIMPVYKVYERAIWKLLGPICAPE